MRKTVVFHIISRFDMGGAERVALNIASSRSEEFSYHVVEVIRGRSSFTRTLLNELRQRGISYHRALIPAVKFHYLFERLAAITFPLWFIFLCVRHRPQVIHSHTEVPDMACQALFTLFPWLKKRIKLVRTVHNTCLWTGLEGTGRRFERFIQSCGVNVAISPNVRDSYAERYGQRPEVIYNGVPEVAQYSFPGIVPTCRNVLFAGRMEPQKGVKTLIKIVKSLKDDARYQFFIIGDGSLKQLIVNELGSQDNVSVLPPQYGLNSHLAAFNLVLMPSEFEGLSLMAIETSLAGVPLVCNRCAGLIDTLPEGWPLSVNGNSVEEYLHLFRKVIPAAGLARLGHEAQQFARSHFGVRLMQERYEALYASQLIRKSTLQRP